jgi:hypothetical protein
MGRDPFGYQPPMLPLEREPRVDLFDTFTCRCQLVANVLHFISGQTSLGSAVDPALGEHRESPQRPDQLLAGAVNSAL